MNLENIQSQLITALEAFAPKLLGAMVALVIGWWVIRILISITKGMLHKKKVDDTLAHFTISFTRVGLWVLLLVSVVSMLGVATTSVIAALGAAGFAVGMALQGSLSNFAGGILLLFFRPFRAGHYVEAMGVAGTIKEIQMFCTVMATPDNKKIILPNGALAGSVMTNFSAYKERRVDLEFGVSYSDDLAEVQTLLKDVASNHPKVLKDKDIFTGVTTYADSSVNLVLRCWCKTEDYWPVHFEIKEKMKSVFDDKGISIPFPQRDLHITHVNGMTGLLADQPKAQLRQ